MNAEPDETHDCPPQGFLDNPSAYDLWQAYVFLELCVAEQHGGGWSFGFPAAQSFPASEIDGIRTGTQAADYSVTLDLAVPGLFGPDGPLPPDLRETLVQERNDGNRALQDFLDLFQNRLMRLWMEEAEGMCAELGTAKEEEEDLPAVCARALSSMMDGDTDAGFAVWTELPEPYRSRLGGVNSRLGSDAIAGTMIIDSYFINFPRTFLEKRHAVYS